MSESGGGGSGAGGVISPSGPVSLGAVRGLFDGSGNLDLSGGAIFRGGSVGIGVTNPSTPLDIRGGVSADVSDNVGTAVFCQNDGGALWESGRAFGRITFGTQGFGLGGIAGLDYRSSRAGSFNGGLAFYSRNNASDGLIDPVHGSPGFFERMRITNIGNVGIGTTSPSQALDVSGSIKASRVLGTSLNNIVDMGVFASDVLGNIDHLLIRSRRKATTLGTIPPGGWLNSSIEMLRLVDGSVVSGLRFGGEGGSQSVSLLTGINGALSQERLTVTETGNVGIGTTAPQRFVHLHTPSDNTYMKFSNTASGNGMNEGLDVGVSAFGDAVLANRTTGKTLAFGTNNLTRMTILSDGNVGIGTTAPESRLHIQGTESSSAQNWPIFWVMTNDTAEERLALQMFTVNPASNINDRAFVIQSTTPGFRNNPLHINPFGGNVVVGGNGTAVPAERLVVAGDSRITGNITIVGSGTIGGQAITSDDRIKVDESHIADALPTILKLKPQTYRKTSALEDTSGGFIESGLIAQEVYYDAPELRHLVHVPPDASGIEVPPAGYGESDDPNEDPDYSNWGSTPAALNYTGLIPYLIRGMQEQEERIRDLEARLSTSSA